MVPYLDILRNGWVGEKNNKNIQNVGFDLKFPKQKDKRRNEG